MLELLYNYKNKPNHNHTDETDNTTKQILSKQSYMTKFVQI